MARIGRRTVLALLLTLGACGELGHTPKPAGRVLWITVPGLPSDRPILLTEGREGGLLFESVWTTSATVRSNVATALTGAGPWLHGIRTDLDDRERVAAAVPALAFARDIWTGAIVSTPALARPEGIEEGFQWFDGETELTAPDAVERGLARLADRGGDREGWFFWLHLQGESVDAALQQLLDWVEDQAWAPTTLIAVVGGTAEEVGPLYRTRAWLRRGHTLRDSTSADVQMADLAPFFLEHLTRLPSRERLALLSGIDGQSPGLALGGLPPHEHPPVLITETGPLAIRWPWWIDSSSEIHTAEGAEEPSADVRAALVDALRKDVERRQP